MAQKVVSRSLLRLSSIFLLPFIYAERLFPSMLHLPADAPWGQISRRLSLSPRAALFLLARKVLKRAFMRFSAMLPAGAIV